MSQDSGEPEAVSNTIHANVLGPVVQARDIHGGIHFHRTAQGIPPPSQLPPPGSLANRKNDLTALDRSLSRCESANTPCVVIVNGPAGIGKTTLAVNWAHSVRERYPDGQLYADLQGHAPSAHQQPDEVLDHFLRSLGVVPEEIPEGLAQRQALYRSLTAGRRIAVLLDDALSAAQVRPLLPATVSSLTVVTSRWRLAGLVAHGAGSLPLDRLDSAGAIDLLAQILGDDRAARQREDAAELVELCALFPLAVCVAGARLASRPQWPISEMVNALAEQHRRLSVLELEGDLAVRSSLDLSYQALPPQARRMHRLAALYPGSTFDSQLMAAALATPLAEARSLLGTLADAHMLEDTPTGRYRFHDLIRVYARGRAEQEDSDAERSAVTERMVGYLLAAASAAEHRLTPDHQTLSREFGTVSQPVFDSDEAALRWLDEERPNLMAVLRWTADNHMSAAVWQLADAMWPLFRLHKYYDDWIAAYELGLAAAHACQDPAAESRMLTSGGLGLMGAGRLSEAEQQFTKALMLNRRMGDQRAEAGALNYLGIALRRSERLEDAARYFTKSLEACLLAGHQRGAGLARLNLGEVALTVGSLEDAVAYLVKAHEDLSAVGDRYDAARALTFLGGAHALAGRPSEGVADLSAALMTFRDVGSPYEEARALEALGQVAAQTGEVESARGHWERALALYEGLPVSPRHVRRVQDRLGSV
jgi:tetratricopeptide (TPR) repeat protein